MCECNLRFTGDDCRVDRMLENATCPLFAVGDPVAFTNERGARTLSHITAIVPVGEYSATEIAYAVRGTYGDYVRVAADIERV